MLADRKIGVIHDGARGTIRLNGGMRWLAWRAMGEATLAEFPDAHGRLLADPDRPGRFISFGPWKSQQQVQEWRASAAFREGVAAMGELLDDFQPGTYELRAEVSKHP